MSYIASWSGGKDSYFACYKTICEGYKVSHLVSGCIFMYDITDYSSINIVENWITVFKQSLSNDRKKIPLLMVGGKLDLRKERVISRRHAKKIPKKYNFLKHFECSSKTGQNIEKIFTFLTRSILKHEKSGRL